MDFMEISILHHACIVLLFLWMLSSVNWCHPIAYFASLVYLYLVHERYIIRLRKKLQFEERKQANRRRVLSDSETVRWLNHAVEKMWPICMEQIASQKILFPIIPWFLEKYKPWTAKQAIVQHLYLGRTPPMITEMRVLRQSGDDDHLVLELGLNFLTADDMSAILSVKLRKRLGFGMWAKLHITGMHVEGKVLVGVKFLREWPYLGRVRLCFVEPPYFQLTVKPLSTHGLDVTELPGIAGFLDKILSVAFEQTLIEPNMLVVDMEKFVSPHSESWFSVDEKEPVAHAKVEVIEASDMKPSDLNGLADPYVKGHLGAYRFRTKTQRKTLAPKWLEEYKIPIVTWETPNVLTVEVRDKDRFVDDTLGDCSVNINDIRDGQRHDMWLPLQNIKTGRLHLAITVLEDNGKGCEDTVDEETFSIEDERNSFMSETSNKGSFSPVASAKSSSVADNFEPINIEGQKETGIWVHHPGSEVSQTWEPRKGKSRLDTKIIRDKNDSFGNQNSTFSGSLKKDSSSGDENPEEKRRMRTVQRGLHKIGSVFHRSPRKEDLSGPLAEAVPFPHANIRATNAKGTSIKIVLEDNLPVPASGISKQVELSAEESGPESPSKRHVKGMAKSFFRHAGNSARTLKNALSRKGSAKFKGDAPLATEKEIEAESDSSGEASLSPLSERTPVTSEVIANGSGNDSPSATKNVHYSPSSGEDVVQEVSFDAPLHPVNKSNSNDLNNNVQPDRHGDILIEIIKPVTVDKEDNMR